MSDSTARQQFESFACLLYSFGGMQKSIGLRGERSVTTEKFDFSIRYFFNRVFINRVAVPGTSQAVADVEKVDPILEELLKALRPNSVTKNSTYFLKTYIL